jgi:hypothetical protein
MKTRRILAGIVGATMALTLAGAVFAVDNNTQLTQTGTIDPTTFANQDCTVPDGVSLPGAGEVLWHFVYTASGTGTLQGEFAFSDGTIDVASTPQGGAGTHEEWWITTDAGVTLNGDDTFTDGTGGNFNLSHVCQGSTPTPTPTLPEVTPTPTLPEVTPTPTLPQTNTIDQSNTGGPGTSLTLVFALILAVAGGLVAYAMRPRRVGNR